MRIMDIPKPIMVPTPRRREDGAVVMGEVELGFRGWLHAALDQNQQLAQGISNIRKAIKLSAAIDADTGDVVRLENDQYETVKQSVDTAKFNPEIVKLFGPFLDALENAQEVDACGKRS